MHAHGKTLLVVLLGLKVGWFEVQAAAADAVGSVRPDRQRSRPTAIRDVSLDAKGLLCGWLVDSQGRTLAGDAVAARQGRKRIAVVRTDKSGRFTLAGLKGGVYQIWSHNSAAVCRVWKHGTAPKRAGCLTLVTRSRPAVRGQLFDGQRTSMLNLAIGAAAVTGATLAIVEGARNDSRKQTGDQGAMSQGVSPQGVVSLSSDGNQDSLSSGVLFGGAERGNGFAVLELSDAGNGLLDVLEVSP